MTVSSMKSGLFYYVSEGDQEACGLYLVGRPDTKVRITLKHLHIDQDCNEEVVVVS